MSQPTQIIESNVCPTLRVTGVDEEGKEIKEQTCLNSHHTKTRGYCAHVVPTDEEGKHTWFVEEDE